MVLFSKSSSSNRVLFSKVFKVVLVVCVLFNSSSNSSSEMLFIKVFSQNSSTRMLFDQSSSRNCGCYSVNYLVKAVIVVVMGVLFSQSNSSSESTI